MVLLELKQANTKFLMAVRLKKAKGKETGRKSDFYLENIGLSKNGNVFLDEGRLSLIKCYKERTRKPKR